MLTLKYVMTRHVWAVVWRHRMYKFLGDVSTVDDVMLGHVHSAARQTADTIPLSFRGTATDVALHCIVLRTMTNSKQVSK